MSSQVRTIDIVLNKFFTDLDKVAKRSELVKRVREFAESIGADIDDVKYFPDKVQVVAEVNVEFNEEQRDLLEYLNAQDYRLVIISPFETNTSVDKLAATTKMLRRVRELAKEMNTDVYLDSRTSEDDCEEKNLVRIPLLVDNNTRTALVLELYERIEKCF